MAGSPGISARQYAAATGDEIRRLSQRDEPVTGQSEERENRDAENRRHGQPVSQPESRRPHVARTAGLRDDGIEGARGPPRDDRRCDPPHVAERDGAQGGSAERPGHLHVDGPHRDRAEVGDHHGAGQTEDAPGLALDSRDGRNRRRGGVVHESGP